MPLHQDFDPIVTKEGWGGAICIITITQVGFMERVRKSIFPPGPLSPIRHLSLVMEFSAQKEKQQNLYLNFYCTYLYTLLLLVVNFFLSLKVYRIAYLINF